MFVRKRFCVTVSLILASLLVAAMLAGASCRKDGVDGFSLDYDERSSVPLIQGRTFGGMPAPWDDRAPYFTLYGNGTVVLRGEDGMTSPLLEGRMSVADIEALLDGIRDTGFFELETFYKSDEVYDYVYNTIEVTVQERSQKVTVYFEKVEAFYEALEAIEEARVTDLEDYVPERGYLVVQSHAATGNDTVLDEGSDVYGLLPDASVLARAEAENQPVVMGGRDFARVKRYAADNGAVGLVLKGNGGDLILYPVYEPR